MEDVRIKAVNICGKPQKLYCVETRIWMHARCTPLAALPAADSVLLPWSEGVSWVFIRPNSEIFAVPPRAPEVAVPFAQWNGGYSLTLLPVLPMGRGGRSTEDYKRFIISA